MVCPLSPSLNIPACWSSGNAFISGAGGLRFKPQAGQIGQSVAKGLLPLQHFFRKSCVARRSNDAKMSHTNLLNAKAYYIEK